MFSFCTEIRKAWRHFEVPSSQDPPSESFPLQDLLWAMTCVEKKNKSNITDDVSWLREVRGAISTRIPYGARLKMKTVKKILSRYIKSGGDFGTNFPPSMSEPVLEREGDEVD